MTILKIRSVWGWREALRNTCQAGAAHGHIELTEAHYVVEMVQCAVDLGSHRGVMQRHMRKSAKSIESTRATSARGLLGSLTERRMQPFRGPRRQGIKARQYGWRNIQCGTHRGASGQSTWTRTRTWSRRPVSAALASRTLPQVFLRLSLWIRRPHRDDVVLVVVASEVGLRMAQRQHAHFQVTSAASKAGSCLARFRG